MYKDSDFDSECFNFPHISLQDNSSCQEWGMLNTQEVKVTPIQLHPSLWIYYLSPGNAVRLLTVQRKSIGLLNVKSQQFEAIQTPVLDPVALTFDVARGGYYWADSRGIIYKSDGQQSSTIYTG